MNNFDVLEDVYYGVFTCVGVNCSKILTSYQTKSL